MFGALLMLAVIGDLAPADLEAQASRHVRGEFERVGRTAPGLDPTLCLAARALAVSALATSVAEAADPLRVAEAVSAAGAADPSPRALIIRGSPREGPLSSFLARKDFNDEPASNFGVGSAVDGERAAVALLLTERKLTLEPFPRVLAKPVPSSLCGRGAPELAPLEAYITIPGGEVRTLKIPLGSEENFCATIDFPSAGQYTVEVLGKGASGPEILSLFFVRAGASRSPDERHRADELDDLKAAPVTLARRINALRRAQGVADVELDAALTAVAQAFADRMAKEGFFAHVDPDGRDLHARLKYAHYAFDKAGENIGMAGGPIQAQFAIERSPAHRRNLIDPSFRRVGIALSRVDGSDRPQVVLAELFARPVEATGDPATDAYQAIDKRRAALKLRALKREPSLEAFARAHAERALALGEPKAELASEKLHARIFEKLPEVSTAAVDFFVTDNPALVLESRNLTDPRNDRMGVAVVRGDAAQRGAGKYWVAVIYAGTR